MDFRNIVQEIRVIFLNLFTLTVYVVALFVVSIISAELAFFLSVCVLLACILYFFIPIKIKNLNWWTEASAILFIAFTIPLAFKFNVESSIRASAKAVAEEQQELAELKLSDPRKYILKLKSSPDSQELYLEEFNKLYPEEYRIEMEKIAKDEDDARQKEYEELKDRLISIKMLSDREKLDLYTSLLNHDPRNKQFVEGYDKYKKIIDDIDQNIADAERARDNPEEFLELVGFSWSKEGFGTVMEATFVIENTSPIDIKDVKIVCTHVAPSGTVIDENSQVIYDIIRAKSKRTFSNVNMGFINSQVEDSNCHIKGAASI